ncbi:MAG: helix-turn-helix domain-containing protein [Spirochaetaceae bacterium]|jgi:transcriptional regulator with XRE-family HTH domain|nr:helix-turn-helix domain-containing protein [Spirochaetaceae bacterium]
MTGLRELLAFNIRCKRRELGLTQTKLAEKVDTAPTYIAMIELRKRFPSAEMLERIARALEIDPPELFAVGAFHVKSVEEIQTAVLLDIQKAVSDRIQAIHTGEI